MKAGDLIGSLIYIIPFKILQRYLFSSIKMSQVPTVTHCLCIETQLQLQSEMREGTSLLILGKQKRILREYHEQLCVNRLDNLDGQIPRKHYRN